MLFLLVIYLLFVYMLILQFIRNFQVYLLELFYLPYLDLILLILNYLLMFYEEIHSLIYQCIFVENLFSPFTLLVVKCNYLWNKVSYLMYLFNGLIFNGQIFCKMKLFLIFGKIFLLIIILNLWPYSQSNFGACYYCYLFKGICALMILIIITFFSHHDHLFLMHEFYYILNQALIFILCWLREEKLTEKYEIFIDFLVLM